MIITKNKYMIGFKNADEFIIMTSEPTRRKAYHTARRIAKRLNKIISVKKVSFIDIYEVKQNEANE